MKKILALAICAAAVLLAIVSGTVAFFTDEESATNVMTVGLVSIELIEQQRNSGASALEDFMQEKPLQPVLNSSKENTDKWGMPSQSSAPGYTDKIVRVKNTGPNPAWVRVFYAVPTALKDVLVVDTGANFIDESGNKLYSADFNSAPQPVGQVQLGNESKISYDVYCATMAQSLPKGDTSAAVIMGCHLNELVDFDGTDYHIGGQRIAYDLSCGVNIPVLAQAVQFDGFEESASAAFVQSFGEITDDKLAEWFANVEVKDAIVREPEQDQQPQGEYTTTVEGYTLYSDVELVEGEDYKVYTGEKPGTSRDFAIYTSHLTAIAMADDAESSDMPIYLGDDVGDVKLYNLNIDTKEGGALSIDTDKSITLTLVGENKFSTEPASPYGSTLQIRNDVTIKGGSLSLNSASLSCISLTDASLTLDGTRVTGSFNGKGNSYDECEVDMHTYGTKHPTLTLMNGAQLSLEGGENGVFHNENAAEDVAGNSWIDVQDSSTLSLKPTERAYVSYANGYRDTTPLVIKANGRTVTGVKDIYKDKEAVDTASFTETNQYTIEACPDKNSDGSSVKDYELVRTLEVK